MILAACCAIAIRNARGQVHEELQDVPSSQMAAILYDKMCSDIRSVYGEVQKKCFVAPVIIFDVTAASYCVQELGDPILLYG